MTIEYIAPANIYPVCFYTDADDPPAPRELVWDVAPMLVIDQATGQKFAVELCRGLLRAVSNANGWVGVKFLCLKKKLPWLHWLGFRAVLRIDYPRPQRGPDDYLRCNQPFYGDFYLLEHTPTDGSEPVVFAAVPRGGWYPPRRQRAVRSPHQLMSCG